MFSLNFPCNTATPVGVLPLKLKHTFLPHWLVYLVNIPDYNLYLFDYINPASSGQMARGGSRYIICCKLEILNCETGTNVSIYVSWLLAIDEFGDCLD